MIVTRSLPHADLEMFCSRREGRRLAGRDAIYASRRERDVTPRWLQCTVVMANRLHQGRKKNLSECWASELVQASGNWRAHSPSGGQCLL